MYAYKLYSRKHSNLHCQLSSFQQKVCNSIDGIPLRQWRTMQGEHNKKTFEGLKQTINTTRISRKQANHESQGKSYNLISKNGDSLEVVSYIQLVLNSLIKLLLYIMRH